MMRWLVWVGLMGVVGLVASGCDLTDPEPDEDGGGGFGGEGGEAGSGGSGGSGGSPMVGCADDDACPAGRPVCLTPAGEDAARCVECGESGDCPDEAPVCQGFSCVSVEGACREDFDCAVARPECVLLPSGGVGTCVECARDGDCPGAEPVCATTGSCVARGAATTCANDRACGPVRACRGGRCVEP